MALEDDLYSETALRLAMEVDRMARGRKRLTARQLLRRFGFAKRGPQNVLIVTEALREAGVTCEPHLADADNLDAPLFITRNDSNSPSIPEIEPFAKDSVDIGSNNIGNDDTETGDSTGHYVYVYKDIKDKARYVGYGRGLDRPVSLNRGNAMREFLLQGKYTLEIAGPYGSRETGLAVETALIAQLRPDFNSPRAPGPSRLQFRPLGVPEQYAGRLSEPALTEWDLAHVDSGRACPLLFVRISDENFDGYDARAGYSLDKPLPDSEILARMDRWWQLGSFISQWIAQPRSSPKTLVGVAGPPNHRIIIGAVTINQREWHQAQPIPGQLYQVPTVVTPNLDAHGLRGRLISPNSNIKFGAIRSQFFVIVDRDGQTIVGSAESNNFVVLSQERLWAWVNTSNYRMLPLITAL